MNDSFYTGEQKDIDRIDTVKEVNQMREDIEVLKKDLPKITDDIKEIKDDIKKDITRVEHWLLAATIFFMVSFVVAIVSIYWDGILSNKSDKDLYLKYNDIFKNYSDQNFELKDKIYEQRIEINNLKNELGNLRVKNPYLK